MPIIDAIAIDLDGTLLSPDKSVSRANIDAIDRARQAGITTLICTGRGLIESRGALSAIHQRDPVMVAGGSIVADPITGQTLHRTSMNHDIVEQTISYFHDAHCAGLVLKDPSDIGYDYLVVHDDPEHEIHPITRWWFEDHGITHRAAPYLHDDEHPEHTVRVGLCAEMSRSAPIARRIKDELGDQVELHDFPCVTPDELTGETVHILEIFDRGATKWGAISWYLEQHDIDPTRVAAIGDQVNDLTMIDGAGIGIAMGNAIDEVKALARYTTASNRHDGVARAIDAILASDLAPLRA